MIKEDIQYPNVQVYYQTSERFVEITLLFNGKQLIQQIDTSEILFNFWSNVNRVRRKTNQFLEETL